MLALQTRFDSDVMEQNKYRPHAPGTCQAREWVPGLFWAHFGHSDPILIEHTGGPDLLWGAVGGVRIQGAFADGVDVGIDHILSDVAPDAGSGSRNGSPSDHPLVKGSFTLSSGQATTAPPTSTSRGNDESCTEEGKDPYASGQNVQCCTGLQSCLGAWSGQGSWHYLCKGSCESRGSFLGRKRSTVKAHGHLQLQQ